jgi:hypothetical protein
LNILNAPHTFGVSHESSLATVSRDSYSPLVSGRDID